MITEQHILQAIQDARAGGALGHTYDQSIWCGTSCCVLGFARLRAGLPELDAGPQPDATLPAGMVRDANGYVAVERGVAYTVRGGKWVKA